METAKSRSTPTDNQAAMVRKTGTKQTPITIPLFMLKFNFPIELWLPLAALDQHGVSIISVNSTSDKIKVMHTLSLSCRYFYQHLKPELEKQGAKKLLECFFYPTKENVEQAMRILKTKPQLAFVKIENDKTITDIRNRCFEGSLLQAAMQTGAVGWQNWLKKEVIEKTNNHDLAKAQYQEKFGQPDERKTRMLAHLDIDLKTIETAFIHDPCTNRQPTLQATINAFETMRQHFCIENQLGILIKIGEFFPLEIMQSIAEVYDKHWIDNSWDFDRRSCYSKFMIGFATRFFAPDDLLRLLRGVSNPPDDQVPLCGDFKQTVQLNGAILELDFTQLDKYPGCQLGFDFFVDVYYGGAEWAGSARAYGSLLTLGVTPGTLEILCRTKTTNLQNYAATPNSETSLVYDGLKK